MLLDQDSCGERGFIVAVVHGNPRLNDHRAAVEFPRDEMDAGAVLRFAGRENLSVRAQTSVPRQQ